VSEAKPLLPLLQGRNDRLCGIYAIINAIRLAVAPRPVRTQRLFDEATEFLIQKRRLNEVMRYGMPTQLWLRLMKHLLDFNNLKGTMCSALPLIGQEGTSEEQIWTAVLVALDQRIPILVEIDGAMKHYSVLSHYDQRRLFLFDSLGSKWIARSSCSIAANSASTRYRLLQRSIFLMPKP
jgi:hypothetical protein